MATPLHPRGVQDMPELRTLPELAREWEESIDRLRELLRKRPDLAKLGKQIGGARCFTPEAVAKIKAAAEAGRKPAATAK